MGPLVTTTGSHAASLALILLRPLSLSVRLIHIDVQKLGLTHKSWLNSSRPPTAVRHYTQSALLKPAIGQWAQTAKHQSPVLEMTNWVLLKTWPLALYCNLSPLYSCFLVVTNSISFFLKNTFLYTFLHKRSCHTTSPPPPPPPISFSLLQSLLPIKAPLILLVSLSGSSLLEVTGVGSCQHFLFIHPFEFRHLAFFKVRTHEKKLSYHDEHLHLYCHLLLKTI